MKKLSPDDYYARNPRPVIMHFQPTQFFLIESDDEFRQWEAALAKKVGLDVKVPQGSAVATTYTMTMSGEDIGDPILGGSDDCEQD